MTDTTLSTFTPDWASPPGDTIADLLEERDWSQSQLAERLGYTQKHVSQLINGKAPLTEETAMRLERVLGSTAQFWLNLESIYRAQLTRLKEDEQLREWVPWLEQLPVKALMDQGIIPKQRQVAKNKPGIVQDLLHFFGVASPEEWESYYGGMEAAFRRTRQDQSNIGVISAWLREGERQAERFSCPRYNRDLFQSVVHQARDLTLLSPAEFMPQLQSLCAQAGVLVVVVPSLPKAHTSGVARWLSPNRALIQLSLYGKSNDKFWFTFFHEAAHILLHSKKEIFLDDFEQGERLVSEQEAEADRWARELLIPVQYEPELPNLRSKEAVKGFAERLGIHPAIVVGRLQYEEIIPMDWMNKDFKESFHINEGAKEPAGDEFDQALDYVLSKNQELYKRLS